MASQADARARMVDRQIAARGVRDARLLDAMRTVPRERFVSEELADAAYRDSPLPIGEGQTISQPYIVALMLEAAEIGPRDRVLEVGAGSGYAAAVAGRIAAHVYAIEWHEALAQAARARLAALGYDNIELRGGDGSGGWPEHAPFDAIIVSAGGPDVPEPLKAQLAIGGRLLIPVGPRLSQTLLKLTRRDRDRFDAQNLGAVAFVPLVGEKGWAGSG
ncbi:MAG TPA: protein-L-isoaspartate(D-aspartate) O-methyltransferase [Sphingomonas sp.]|nr:protein-L-isoaspartate(D-aspartate) O-methyltransferase [Sphingomonas sp.]